MPRYIRNTLILAKVETTIGVDAAPTGSADAVLISDMTITPLDAQNVDRALVRGYLGASEQLVSTASVQCSFTVELAGSGTAGTAPQWGDLLLGCGFAESVLATPNRVEYTPQTTSLKTLTIYWYDDGVLHKLLGAMGNVQIMAQAGDRPKLMFEFRGLDGGISATSNPSPTFTAWRTPPTMARSNITADITLGCTYSAGALSGGTAYPSTGVEVNMGNAVEYIPLLSSDRVDLTDRQATGRMRLDLTPAQEVTLMAAVKANTTQGLGMHIGTAAGNRVILHAPATQLINPRKEDLSGSRMLGYDLRFVPVSGNDELRIVTQ